MKRASPGECRVVLSRVLLVSANARFSVQMLVHTYSSTVSLIARGQVYFLVAR